MIEHKASLTTNACVHNYLPFREVDVVRIIYPEITWWDRLCAFVALLWFIAPFVGVVIWWVRR